eukprot:scaffold40219_cov69-Phaeocystis_antarctica.AAC.3
MRIRVGRNVDADARLGRARRAASARLSVAVRLSVHREEARAAGCASLPPRRVVRTDHQLLAEGTGNSHSQHVELSARCLLKLGRIGKGRGV